MNRRFNKTQKILLGLLLVLSLIICSYLFTPLFQLSNSKNYKVDNLISSIYLNENFYFEFKDNVKGIYKEDISGKLSEFFFTYTFNEDGLINVLLSNNESYILIFYKDDMIFNITNKDFLYLYLEAK